MTAVPGSLLQTENSWRVLGRSAKFVETELKLMQEMQKVFDEEAKVADLMDQLHITQRAHMRYIQEEFNSLQIGGQYGAQAKQMFKSIRRNTTLYTPAFLDDIKTVLNVTGASQNQGNPRHFWGGTFRPRFQNPRFFGNNQQFRPRRFFNPPSAPCQPRPIPNGRDDME